MREHIHKFQWFYLTFLVIIFIGLGAYYFVHFGYYPVAVVNNSLITSNELDNEFSLAHRYYSTVLRGKEGYNVESLDFKKELRRAALESLIEKTLIYKEAKARLGGELNNSVDIKINKEISDPGKIEEAAKLLYGMNLADFRQLILVPQARREILDSRLVLEKTNFQTWLSGAKKSAKVFILTPRFYWKERVEVRD